MVYIPKCVYSIFPIIKCIFANVYSSGMRPMGIQRSMDPNIDR
uniref:Uncharacterized protein n=1 Tax=Heterorhabditis bacteriophora TaxID=37862 RepID=A0A1I7W885_HETBA